MNQITMQGLIEDARERADYVPPTLEQCHFADRVVLLTQDRRDGSLLSLAYAEGCLVGNMSDPLIDRAAKLKVLMAINQEDIDVFLSGDSRAA